jgi:hypothetical protein
MARVTPRSGVDRPIAQGDRPFRLPRATGLIRLVTVEDRAPVRRRFCCRPGGWAGDAPDGHFDVMWKAHGRVTPADVTCHPSRVGVVIGAGAVEQDRC